MTKKIRVLAVDDHPLLREGIAAVIDGEDDIELVAEATTGEEAIALFPSPSSGCNADGLADAWHERYRSNHSNSQRIFGRALHCADYLPGRCSGFGLSAGASGYLLKNMLRKELLDTIRAVNDGRRRVRPKSPPNSPTT